MNHFSPPEAQLLHKKTANPIDLTKEEDLLGNQEQRLAPKSPKYDDVWFKREGPITILQTTMATGILPNKSRSWSRKASRNSMCFARICVRDEISFIKSHSLILLRGDRFCGDSWQAISKVHKESDNFTSNRIESTQTLLEFNQWQSLRI